MKERLCANFYCKNKITTFGKGRKRFCLYCKRGRTRISKIRCNRCNEPFEPINPMQKLNCPICDVIKRITKYENQNAMRNIIKRNQKRTCKNCGNPLPKESHLNRQFCKNSCERHYYLVHVQKGEEYQKHNNTKCKRDVCKNTLKGTPLNRKFCSDFCRKKHYNDRYYVHTKSFNAQLVTIS